MRAVHIEIAPSLSTDAFINASRRFVGRRGHPRAMFSDNATNKVGAERELRESLKEMNNSRFASFLLNLRIEWHFNPPYASRMGGIWERVIRSIRRILQSMLTQQSVTDDVLLAVMIEVESILNSRPLIPVLLDQILVFL